MNIVQRFVDAMSFFTCLVPGRLFSGVPVGECVPCLYPCGAVIGALASLVAWLALLFFADGQSAALLPALLAGLVWVVTELCVTRALHWDAVADLADAVGSCRQGDEFHAVLKDSHIGAFGVIALVTVFAAELLGAAAHVDQGQWLVLVLAPAWGKIMAVPLFCFCMPHGQKGLGAQFACAGTLDNLAIFIVLVTLSLALLRLAGIGWVPIFVLCAAQTLLVVKILALTSRQEGYSGDFCGALMQTGQCLFLLATV